MFLVPQRSFYDMRFGHVLVFWYRIVVMVQGLMNVYAQYAPAVASEGQLEAPKRDP